VLLTTPAALTNGINPALNAVTGSPTPPQRLGEDVILTDVLAFDIRVFDPTVALAVSGNVALTPSDPGYTPPSPPTAFGGFVDLGYGGCTSSSRPLNGPLVNTPTLASHFSAYPNAAAWYMINTTSGPGPGSVFTQAAKLLPQTYDTWSWGEEQNGIDDDQNGIIDQGTDGLDDDTTIGQGSSATSAPNGIVDDAPQITVPYINGTPPTVTNGTISAGERETLAPYPFPLRGVQIKIRVYEPDTRQVREVTVVQDFLPD
jgi:hypothetical protein